MNIFFFVLLILILVLIILVLRKISFFRIKCKIIEVSNTTELNYDSKILRKERFLRSKAYESSPITISKSFYDDSDINTNYFLTVLYDSQTGIPLLSSRHYFDQKIIQSKLNGENSKEMQVNSNSQLTCLENFKEGEIFLIDRLSTNIGNQIFIKNRSLIFLKYYISLYNENKGKQYFLMARSEKFEKLLTKYIRLGLFIVGKTKHNGLDHWILLGDFNVTIKMLKKQMVLFILSIPTYLFKSKP